MKLKKFKDLPVLKYREKGMVTPPPLGWFGGTSGGPWVGFDNNTKTNKPSSYKKHF